jgi:hypothetical protein
LIKEEETMANKLFREGKMTIRYIDDGVVLSDLNIASVVKTLLENDGVDADVIREDGNPPRLFFRIRALNPDGTISQNTVAKIREVITAFFAGTLDKQGEQLKKFTNNFAYFKTLLDKSNVRITDSSGGSQ